MDAEFPPRATQAGPPSGFVMMQQESPTLAAQVGSALARRSSEISSTWRRRSRVVGESRGQAADPAAAEPAVTYTR